MLPHRGPFTRIRPPCIEERHARLEDAGIARGDEVLSEGDERPEDNVTVRVARADISLPLEEHEPLRPIAVRILVGHDAKHYVAQRLDAPHCEQHLDRSLTDIARAPAAARVLLEPAGGEIVDERILRVPRHHFGKMARLLCRRPRHRRLERQSRYERLFGPEPPGLLTLLREELSANDQARPPRGRGLDAEIGLLTRAPIQKQ